jgi:hypothetical protein
MVKGVSFQTSQAHSSYPMEKMQPRKETPAACIIIPIKPHGSKENVQGIKQ